MQTIKIRNQLGIFLSLCTLGFSASSFAMDRSANISVNPLGLLVGLANLSADFGVAPNIAIGPELSFASVSSTSGSVKSSATIFGVAGSMTAFLGHPRFTDSWFVRPFVGYSVVSGTSTSASGVRVGADFGYWWFWDSGFDLGLGLGIQYISANFSSVGVSVSSTWPSALFQIGYSF